MKGKNFSCNNSGKRRKSDFYVTPYSLTRLLLDDVSLGEPILEPSEGNGAITKVLKEYGHHSVVGQDINTTGHDFLNEQHKYHTIITNPPYSLAFQFIQKAKQISEEFYFLLPLSYLHGKQRFDHIYQDTLFPLESVRLFTRYPLLTGPEDTREDGKFQTGMVVYAWYHWQKGYIGEPMIKWLDNNEFVVKKGE